MAGDVARFLGRERRVIAGQGRRPRSLPSVGGSWLSGHLIEGVLAELARVPFADTSVFKVPPQLSDEQVLFLVDILEGGRLDPTRFATYRFPLSATEEAYDVFGAVAETHALEVVLEATPVGHDLIVPEEQLVGV